MSTATVKIEAVYTPRPGSDWFDIKDSTGTRYSTRKREIADQAKALEGQVAILSFTERQNGQWTNRYLDAALPALPDADIPFGEQLADFQNEALKPETQVVPVEEFTGKQWGGDTKDRSVVLSYAKDVTCAFVQAGVLGPEDNITELTVSLANDFYDWLRG